ncbi:MAG: hypothetical protein M3255_10005, partial [Pseudomonadota bacterium]|nr:hypothetical protein [Pseudomonadota bacterium]
MKTQSADIIGRTPIQRLGGEGHNAQLRGNGQSPSNTCSPLPVLLRRTGLCRVPKEYTPECHRPQAFGVKGRFFLSLILNR